MHKIYIRLSNVERRATVLRNMRIDTLPIAAVRTQIYIKSPIRCARRIWRGLSGDQQYASVCIDESSRPCTNSARVYNNIIIRFRWVSRPVYVCVDTDRCNQIKTRRDVCICARIELQT